MNAGRHLRTVDFPCCWVHLHSDYIQTVFKADRTKSVFAPTGTPEFRAASVEMGYSDTMLYAVEHELAHQIVALERGEPYSRVVWADAHKIPMLAHDGYFQDEEHLVNRLQKFMNLGVVDEDYGCLRGVFADRLESVSNRLRFTSRIT